MSEFSSLTQSARRC